MWGWHCCWRGGRGLDAVLDGSLGVQPGRVGVACACRAVFADPGGPRVEVGGGCLGIRVGLWSVGSGWLLVDGAFWHGLRGGGAAAGGRVLLVGPGPVSARAPTPAGPWGRMVAQMS